MGKLFRMILNTMRSGLEIMPVPMKDPGAMIGPATSTDQETSRGEGRTRTSKEMGLLRRVSMAPHHLLARTRCHLTMGRATCRRRMLVVANLTISPKCQTHRQATTVAVLLTTSKVVLLATKVDLQGIKVVTKVTKGTQAQPTRVVTLVTKVVTLATKVAHLVTLVATHHLHLPTKGATPTHRHMRVVAVLATLVATKVKEATRTSNEHDHEY